MPGPPALADGEVHVWRAAAPAGVFSFRAMFALLSDDERERAARYYFEGDRERFVVWRGLLRTLLGLYLGRPAAGLRFAYNEYGKPSVEGGSGGDLRFNLAHSHDMALYAFARGREVGVDVELVWGEFAGEEIAERFFSPREVGALRALPWEQKARAFFECWTRREAYVKARGGGLSLPLDSFDVAFGPGQPAAPLAVRDGSASNLDYSVRGLTPAPDYAAALAASPAARRVSLFAWEWGGAARSGFSNSPCGGG